jgi:hypothetical protein
MIALLLLCVGRGSCRLLLVLIDLMGLYLWFAYATFQSMLPDKTYPLTTRESTSRRICSGRALSAKRQVGEAFDSGNYD